MDRYLTYSSSEFVHDADFLNWVNHGKQHMLVDQRWRTWLENNPHKADEIEEARMLVFTLAKEPAVVASRLLRDQVWVRIQSTLRDNDEPLEQPPLISRWYSKLAVTIGLIALIAVFVTRRPAHVSQPKVAAVEAGSSTILIKANQEAQTLVLSDGSSIVLMPGSTLEYPRDFSSLHRDVYLSGEAYFEVSDETNQPFVVRTSHLTLAALGTSFNVRGYENEDDTRLQVKNGRASVTQNDATSASSIVLLSNHQAVFRHLDKKMIRSLVDDPGILVPLAQVNFLFHGTPIKTVFESIEHAYGIDIAFNELKFSGCVLDADLNELPLYGKLKTICDKVACSYEVIDSRIVMHGGGCEAGFAKVVGGL
jgi:transmembrane sensor